MASKRRLRRRSCEGKQVHVTETEAAAHAKALGHGIKWYRCEFGGHWHVGRPNARQRQSYRALSKRKDA